MTLDMTSTTGTCVCCTDGARPAFWDEGAGEWVHIDDDTAAVMEHVHYAVALLDSAGAQGLTVATTRLPHAGQTESDLWRAVLHDMINPLADDGWMEIFDGSRAVWTEKAANGSFVSATAAKCNDGACARKGHVTDVVVGRLMIQQDAGEEFLTGPGTFHVHSSYAGRDCDGGHGTSSTASPDSNAGAGVFWAGEVRWLVGGYVDYGKLEVRAGRARWYTPTDEGYSSREIVACLNEACVNRRAEVYDEYAVLAGY